MSYPRPLADIQYDAHQYSLSRGFWSHDDGSHCVDSEKIALMHSELSEALDALRDGDSEKVQLELADCVLRILDYAEARGLHIDRGIRDIEQSRELRPAGHGRASF